MRRSLCLSILVAAFAAPWSASAEEPSPPPSLLGYAVAIEEPGSTSFVPAASAARDGHVYGLVPACGMGATYICYAASLCSDGGVDGTNYEVTRDGIRTGSIRCVTEPQAATPQEQVTPGRVLRAFRSLTWPQSDLSIQPAGKTLVNFETNFYTDNSAPSRQSVTLLNQDVLIEATPTTYTWRFGDGDALDTSIPGSAYPALDITHSYVTADSFGPSLDTTYSGRYRLNGGPWTTIPETLTVTGAPQSLQSVEARPTLVDY